MVFSWAMVCGWAKAEGQGWGLQARTHSWARVQSHRTVHFEISLTPSYTAFWPWAALLLPDYQVLAADHPHRMQVLKSVLHQFLSFESLGNSVRARSESSRSLSFLREGGFTLVSPLLQSLSCVYLISYFLNCTSPSLTVVMLHWSWQSQWEKN